MPSYSSNHTDDTSADSSLDYKFQFALKNMLPVPSNSEQQIILDEYNLQLSQFSIAINRIIKEEKSDDNCVELLKLMAGMYTLLKTTLLNPPVYRQLFNSIQSIEQDAHHFISTWSLTASFDKQVELFELGWWCEAAIPRAYLVTLLFYSMEELWKDPKYLADTFSVCKSIQHALKGSFLYSRLHSFLKRIYIKSEGEEMRTLLIGYSVETFTTLLRLFCRWHQSLPTRSTETSYIASLYEESFAKFFIELGGMCEYDLFEEVVLPTILTEVVNSGDLLAQTLVFTSLIQEFDGDYLLAQLGQLIKASSQFAQGIDLKMLLNQLFVKVQKVNNDNNEIFFETIWMETSHLIKSRGEIDQSDTVIISSLILSLISNCTQNQNSIETVLGFLIKTLKTIRPEGFNPETTSVGQEIVQLIKNLLNEFDFEETVLRIESLPELLNCLTAKGARKCCLQEILPKLTMITKENISLVMRLFGCLSKTDLIQLCDNEFDIETLKQVTSDLNNFTESLLNYVTADMVKVLFDVVNSASSCLNLFLLPKLLQITPFNESFYKSLTSSMLQNTSTVLPQRLEETCEDLKWIESEFTKMMAVKMNLTAIEKITESDGDPYEFYTEILNILNNNVSQDYLKIEIIKTVLESINKTKSLLNSDDFKCLLDHLSKEACQLLKKYDRCLLLMKIIDTFNDSGDDSHDHVLKYIDQLIGLLSQLPTADEGLKFDLACNLMKIDQFNSRKRQGENLYQWMKGYVERNPSREVQFYTIKLKYEERDDATSEDDGYADRDYENNNSDHEHNNNNNHTTTHTTHTTTSNNNLLEDDLQKLKIFESFQMQ